MIRRLVRACDPLLQSRAGTLVVTSLFRLWVAAVERRPPAEALRRLLGQSDLLEGRIDLLAIELDDGVHAKHRLIGYHDFFVHRVRPGERVLDVGCGKGELAHDLVADAGAAVTGIDVNTRSLAFARSRYEDPGLELVEADAREWTPPHPYDVLVFSNVLEHLDERVELVRRLLRETGASRVLMRLPAADRHWLVPLRQELGLPYFSDPTHVTEYTVEQLGEELHAFGLELVELVQRWGELWVEARPGAPGTGVS